MNERFSITELYAWSPSSLTFLAEDRSFQRHCGVSRPVMLKYVLNPNQGAEEARFLHKLGGTGVCPRISNLFTVDSAYFRKRFGRLLRRIEGIGFTFPLGETLAVMVLEGYSGEPVIRLRRGKPENDFERRVLIRHGDVTLEGVEYLDDRMLVAGAFRRLEFLINLAKAIRVCHQNGVVHSDLKPENILWQQGQKPMLINFGNTRSFGSPGWESPAHKAYKKGDLPVVGPEADVWTLGQYVDRLIYGVQGCQEWLEHCDQGKVSLCQMILWLEDCQKQAFPKVS